MQFSHQRGRFAGYTFLTLFTLLAALLVSSQPAAAAGDPYGWSNCNNRTRTASRAIVVSTTTNYPFALNGTGDGVPNSWSNRISSSVSNLSGVLTYSAGGNRPYGARLADGVDNNADIKIYYKDISSQTDFGSTEGLSALCGRQLSNPRRQITETAYVNINKRDDWFTQNDDRRSYWEQNCRAGTGTSYTCSKHWDSGGTILHELSHAAGTLIHPNQIDDYNGSGSTSYNLAKCADPTQSATICTAYGFSSASDSYYWWRSNRRTFETYDVTSFNRAEN